MDINPENLNALKKKASNSLKKILFNDLNEDLPDLDEKVDELVKRLLQEGPSTLEPEKAHFTNFFESFFKISNEKSFKEYQDMNNLIQSMNNLVQSRYIRDNQSQVQLDSSYIILENNNNSVPVEPPRVENINETPAPKDLSQREILKEEPKPLLNEREVEEIPVNNAILKETFTLLKNQSDKYDDNFTLTLDLSQSGDFNKESLMLPIIKEHKEKDFISLFNALRPLLFDLLKRREGFEDFTQALKKLAKKEKIACKNIIEKLEVKDILVLLAESCSDVSLPQLGLWFSYQFYPLPLISLFGQKEYRLNLECCLEYLFQVRKPLITSIGTKSAIGLGKSSFLSYLFSVKNPTYFSTKNGFTHFGAVDLYVNLPSDQQNYIVADVHSYREEDQEYMKMISGVLSASQVVLVHITKEDIQEKDGKVKLNLKINNSKILYLWRDYDGDEDEDLLEKVEKSLYDNELGVIGIPKLNGEQSYSVQNDKSEAMEMIFEKIKALNLQSCTPMLDLFKTFTQALAADNVAINFDTEAEEIRGLLEQGVNRVPGQSFTKSLLPCLFQDYRIIEEKKKKKALSKKQMEEMSEQVAREHEEKYKQIQKNIEEREKQKKEIGVSSLIQKVMDVIASNQLHRILLLSEVINNWKMPQFEALRKKYIVLSADKDGGAKFDAEKKDLVAQMDDKDLSLSTFLDEVLSYYESNNNVKDTPEYSGIKKYLLANMLQGAPLNLVNGKTLKFGNELFNEIFGRDIGDMKNIFVISIIGAQSSAKSTLLNVLFGCGFSTSAGRCTKGIYISLLHHPSGFKIMVIDTEGLLSVMARDHEFDNLIATMAFSCSHVVIINNKGEINSKLKDLLEICVYAIKHLKLTYIKPKIVFALRDIADNSSLTQQEMLLAMKDSLEQAANKLSININQIIDFSQEDIFLLPSAFQLVQGDNKTSVQTNNSLFSKRVLEMRQYIFKYLTSIPDQSQPSLRLFYTETKKLWNNVSQLGSDIMRAKNFLEIELKDEALGKVNTICQVHSEKLLANGQVLVDHHKAKLKKYNFDSTAAFVQVLSQEFNNIKEMAMRELDAKIINNERYAIIANYFKEFREIVDYNLRWQKLRFANDWSATILSWETDKEIKKFKADIREKVNEKIKSVSLANLTVEINNYFMDLTKRLQKEFDQQMNRLRNNITQNLPGEIYSFFDRAHQVANSENVSERVLMPAWNDTFDRIMGHKTDKYDPEGFYKPNFKKKKAGKGQIEKIMAEFTNFVYNLYLIIDGKPREETARNVIQDCLARIRKMEERDICVNRTTFMNSCLLEAMNFQYVKAFEVETGNIQQKQTEFENIIEREEQYVTELLKESSNSLAQGVRCAKQWFREIKTNFCVEQGLVIQQAIIREVRNKFPAPETANKKAYKRGFMKDNYKDSLKYILNINLLIKEIYEAKIQKLTDKETNRNIENQASIFINLMRQTLQAVQEWKDDQKGKGHQIELGTLISYIHKNEDLKRYFPDLYAISLVDIEIFTRGCTEEIAKLIQVDNVKKELDDAITQKIHDYLQSQYQTITGCQARCPMCNNKCTRADSNHKDHHTDCHLLAGFSGSYDERTDELLLWGCFDKTSYSCPWSRGEKKFKSYDEMIDKEFPDWRAEFPRKEQTEKLTTEVAKEIKRAWVATKDVLARYHGRKEKTPKQWLELVEPSKRLPRDTVLDNGYMQQSS